MTFALRRSAAVYVLLAPLAAVRLAAQCADGTPPPCEVRAEQVIARATPPPSAAERGRSFLILPFRNITRAPEHEWLVEGSPVLLSDALGQWEEVTVVPPERLAPALRRHGLTPGEVMDEAGVRRVAEETGGWTAVTGEVLATGGRMRVSARAYDVATNRVVVQATGEGDASDPRAAYEQLAGQLLRTAGLDVDAPNLSAATTNSLDAYKAYLQGLSHYHRSEFRQAREWFGAAVRFDSTFAQAYMKLAQSSFTTAEAFQNPQAPGYRYAEKAAALSQRLPRRDRQLIQSLTALLHGQLGVAREGLERLIAADSNDLEALSNLAGLELFDPILVRQGGVERPRGSLNEAARLAKRVLAIDPTRYQSYGTLVGVYSRAGGQGYGRVNALREEQPSLFALLQAWVVRPARVYSAVLRDSIELVPAESLHTIDSDSLDAARRRAREVAKAWLGRWLAATPDAGLANLMASQVYALDERYDVALTFLNRAESLGVEYELFENFAGRRLALFAQLGRYQDALWIADSLMGAGYFKPASILQNPLAQHDAAWVYNLNLLMGRFDGAEQVVKDFRDLVLQQNPMLDSLRALQGTLCYLGCRTDITLPANFPEIPAEFRMTVLDSLLGHLEDLPRGGLIGSHAGAVIGGFFRNAPETDIQRFSERLIKTASRLVKAGRTDLGVGLGIAVAGMDTTRERLEEVFLLLNDIVQREPANMEAHYQIGKVGALTGDHLLLAQRSLEFYLGREVPPEAAPHAHAHWRLGMVYEHMGKIDEAREQYVKALELDPDHARAKAALEKLMEGSN